MPVTKKINKTKQAKSQKQNKKTMEKQSKPQQKKQTKGKKPKKLFEIEILKYYDPSTDSLIEKPKLQIKLDKSKTPIFCVIHSDYPCDKPKYGRTNLVGVYDSLETATLNLYRSIYEKIKETFEADGQEMDEYNQESYEYAKDSDFPSKQAYTTQQIQETWYHYPEDLYEYAIQIRYLNDNFGHDCRLAKKGGAKFS